MLEVWRIAAVGIVRILLSCGCEMGDGICIGMNIVVDVMEGLATRVMLGTLGSVAVLTKVLCAIVSSFAGDGMSSLRTTSCFYRLLKARNSQCLQTMTIEERRIKYERRIFCS